MHDIIEKNLSDLVEAYPELSGSRESITKAIVTLAECFCNGGKLLLAGNGGSAADCDHIVGELMKSFTRKRSLPKELQCKLEQEFPKEAELYIKHLQQGLSAIALTAHGALISAYNNDEEPSLVYAQQVLGYGEQGDVLLGISTSGNSVNVCHALRLARAKGLYTIGLTGSAGGAFKELGDIVIQVPRSITATVQELHLPVYHCICQSLEDIFFL